MTTKSRPIDDRQVTGYLNNKYIRLFRAYVTVNEMGTSEAINLMAKKFFESMSESDRVNLLHRFENPID